MHDARAQARFAHESIRVDVRVQHHRHHRHRRHSIDGSNSRAPACAQSPARRNNCATRVATRRAWYFWFFLCARSFSRSRWALGKSTCALPAGAQTQTCIYYIYTKNTRVVSHGMMRCFDHKLQLNVFFFFCEQPPRVFASSNCSSVCSHLWEEIGKYVQSNHIMTSGSNHITVDINNIVERLIIHLIFETQLFDLRSFPDHKCTLRTSSGCRRAVVSSP